MPIRDNSEVDPWASLRPPTRQKSNLPVQPVYRALQLGVASAVLLSVRLATGALLYVLSAVVNSSRASFSRGDLRTSVRPVKCWIRIRQVVIQP